MSASVVRLCKVQGARGHNGQQEETPATPPLPYDREAYPRRFFATNSQLTRFHHAAIYCGRALR